MLARLSQANRGVEGDEMQRSRLSHERGKDLDITLSSIQPDLLAISD